MQLQRIQIVHTIDIISMVWYEEITGGHADTQG